MDRGLSLMKTHLQPSIHCILKPLILFVIHSLLNTITKSPSFWNKAMECKWHLLKRSQAGLELHINNWVDYNPSHYAEAPVRRIGQIPVESKCLWRSFFSAIKSGWFEGIFCMSRFLCTSLGLNEMSTRVFFFIEIIHACV